MKKKLIKIGNVILDILVILIMVISLAVVVLSTTSKKNGVANLFGYTFLSVQTDSMEPTINAGDLIVGRVTETDGEYNLNDVVTYKQIENKQIIYITHRIVTKENVDGVYRYETKGDNTPGRDDGYIVASDILSVWEGTKYDGVGNVVDYLRSGTGFFLFLMVPVILFFLFYLYRFVKNLLAYNREKTVEEAKKVSVQMDEAQKQRIIAEYLAAQAKANNSENNPDVSKDDTKV